MVEHAQSSGCSASTDAVPESAPERRCKDAGSDVFGAEALVAGAAAAMRGVEL